MHVIHIHTAIICSSDKISSGVKPTPIIPIPEIIPIIVIKKINLSVTINKNNVK